MTQEQRVELLPELRVVDNLQDNLKAHATPDGQLANDTVASIANIDGNVTSNSDLTVKQDLSEEQLEAVTGGFNAVAAMADLGYVTLSVASLGLLPTLDAAMKTGLWKSCNNA